MLRQDYGMRVSHGVGSDSFTTGAAGDVFAYQRAKDFAERSRVSDARSWADLLTNFCLYECPVINLVTSVEHLEESVIGILLLRIVEEETVCPATTH